MAKKKKMPLLSILNFEELDEETLIELKKNGIKTGITAFHYQKINFKKILSS